MRYKMNAYDKLFSSSIKIPDDFINRKEIRSKISQYCAEYNTCLIDYCRIVAISGIGGIGKTHLIRKIKSEAMEHIPESCFIHITFEIQENEQILENLIKLRRAFGHMCPLFDYTLLLYWDREAIYRPNDDFAKLLRQGFISTLGNIGTTFCSVPAFSDIFEAINSLNTKVSEYKFKELLPNINAMESDELLEHLPVFLGADIAEYTDKHSANYIFIFDAYEQSQPYSESKEWLLKFIKTTQKGLFIITSREKLKWSFESDKFTSYELQSYPAEEARMYLEKYIERKDIIDAIIHSTKCVPIYVSLALEIYINESKIASVELIKKSIFKDRNLLVKHFISHLKVSWQETILTLATIKIFNERILDHLVTDLNLTFSKLEYSDLVQVSLVNYVETSDELIKIHDVFCSNALQILSIEEKYKIFQSYLDFFCHRELYHLKRENNFAAITTLYLNILNLYIDFNEYLSPSAKTNESIIECFLKMCDMHVSIVIPAPSKNYSHVLNDIFYFFNAVSHERENTKTTMNWLTSVKQPELFGVHEKSYRVLQSYVRSLTGYYDEFGKFLEKSNNILKDNERAYWYYNKIKIYLADYYMMAGNFKDALQLLDVIVNNDSLDSKLNLYDIFLAERSIGHLMRFNFEIEHAYSIYNKLLNRYQDTITLKVYLLTNLCETECYCRTNNFNQHFKEAMRYTNQLHNLKNKAKLYYARAISRLFSGDFIAAREDIALSIQINEQDGYESGKLFAYIAEGLCDYAQWGHIKASTLDNIDTLINKNHVYEYLRLPIYITNNNSDGINNLKRLRWLNFDNTFKGWRHYLNQLRHITHTS